MTQRGPGGNVTGLSNLSPELVGKCLELLKQAVPGDWHRAALFGQVQRKNGSIILLDDGGVERVRWNFFNGWPSKWDGPALNAAGNDVAIETLTIVCERVELA